MVYSCREYLTQDLAYHKHSCRQLQTFEKTKDIHTLKLTQKVVNNPKQPQDDHIDQTDPKVAQNRIHSS